MLEGSVQRSGNRVRVNAQLIAAETDAHLWAERFDRDMGDLLALQDEITRGIAGALNAELIAAEAARPTEHLDTLDYILRGRAVWSGWPTEENYAQAVRLFDQALALDPQCPWRRRLGWRMCCHSTLSANEPIEPPTTLHARRSWTSKALAASPRNSHAHYDKAQILRRAQGRCREAIPEYETVISLNPNFGSAYANLGWCKFLTGSIEDVIPLRKRPCASLPAAPSSTLCIYGLGRHICRSRITKTRSAGWRRPRNATLWPAEERSYLASAYALTGQNERAAVELAEARRMSPDDRYSSIARLRAVEHYGASKIRDLREATYFAGLRKAGMPEE